MPEYGAAIPQFTSLTRQVLRLSKENAELRAQLKEQEERISRVERWIEYEDNYRREQLERS
jgi:hypothetical protein